MLKKCERSFTCADVHGWTNPDNAGAYCQGTERFPEILHLHMDVLIRAMHGAIADGREFQVVRHFDDN